MIKNLLDFLDKTGYKITSLPQGFEPIMPENLSRYSLDKLKEFLVTVTTWRSFLANQAVIINMEHRSAKFNMERKLAELENNMVLQKKHKVDAKRDKKYIKKQEEYYTLSSKKEILSHRIENLDKALETINRLITIQLKEKDVLSSPRNTGV